MTHISQQARELLACPFCNDDQSSFAGMVPEAFSRCSDGTLSVNCTCGAIGPGGKTMSEAITAWNTRSPTEREKKLAAALKPFANLEIPRVKPVGNAGAYSILFDDIERARTTLKETGHAE